MLLSLKIPNPFNCLICKNLELRSIPVRMPGKKRSGKKPNKKNAKVVQYTQGLPNPKPRNYISYATATGDMHAVHALTNPFSDHARGAKIPDADSSRSVAMQIVDLNTFDADANGRLAVSFVGSMGGTVTAAATMNSTQVTAWSTTAALSDYTTLTGALDKYRIVSWGIRVYSTLAPTSRSGWFKVITLPERFATPFTYNSGFFEEVKAYPMTEDSVHWISKPIGSSWKEYSTFASTGFLAWDNVIVVAAGLPASAVGALCVEVVYNIEAQPKLGSLTGSAATPAADYKPHVLTASAKTLARHGGSHAGNAFGAVIASFAESALRSAANAVVPGLGNVLSGLKGRNSVPMIVD